MRISDWSSDVCSSDLAASSPAPSTRARQHAGKYGTGATGGKAASLRHLEGNAVFLRQIGFAAQKNRAAAAQLHHLALDEGHLAGGAAHVGSVGAVVLQEDLATHRLDRPVPARGVGHRKRGAEGKGG